MIDTRRISDGGHGWLRVDRATYDPIWVVQWGPGLTQTVICLTRAEADEVAETHRPAGDAVEPLVGFRAS